MRAITFAMLMGLLARTASAESPDYGCAANVPTEWGELRMKHRGTSGEADVEDLWQTRVSLCRRLQAGELGPAEAHAEFERARTRVIRKWEEELGASHAG